MLLLSAVRNDMLLISFITTKFCSSRLKFYNRARDTQDTWPTAKDMSHYKWMHSKVKLTHMRFGPENKDLSNHSEELLCIRVWACQPPCPATAQIALSLTTSSPNETFMKRWVHCVGILKNVIVLYLLLSTYRISRGYRAYKSLQRTANSSRIVPSSSSPSDFPSIRKWSSSATTLEVRFFSFSIVGMKWDLSISGFALLTMGCENTKRENKCSHLTCTKPHFSVLCRKRV